LKRRITSVFLLNSLIDFNIRNRRETEAETERIRTSQTAAERALEAREKSHRARVKALEDQVIFQSYNSIFSIYRILRSQHSKNNFIKKCVNVNHILLVH
jgi:hypothetical protein